MVWLLPAAMAGLGYLQGEKKRQQELAMARGNAEANRYSPWTHVNNAVNAPTSDGIGSALQGGLSGAMMAQSMGKFGDSKPNVAPTAEQTQSSESSMVADMPGVDDAYQMPQFGRRRRGPWG